MSVYAPGTINLWRTIETYGIDPAPLFAKEGISLQYPIDPHLRLPYKKIDRVRARAVELSGDEAFGLKTATVFTPSQLGALGYAWQASLTLRRACMRLERFIRLVNEKGRTRIEDRDDCMVISMSLNLESQCQMARDDCALALVTLMCRSISADDFRLQSVSFMHPAPKDIKPYFEFFGCQLNFDQPANQLLVPLRFADEVLAGASPELALLNDKVIIRQLAMIDKADIVAQVTAVMIDQLPLGHISDDSVANALNMSVRTMHRKLTDANSSFRSMLVDIRRELAEAYILDNSLTLTEISLLLGFSEQSSFSRAFKNWTGNAPSAVRQAAAQP